MALLGQLTVGILGDLSGYSKTISQAQKETIKFGKKMESIGKNISSVGYGIQDLGSNLTNKITKPAVVAATALTGMVSALGFKRLVGMDNARAKLVGLGVEGKQLEVVMDNARAAVTGTTHTMADGVDTAAGALAAGVKEGKDLERYIKLVGDAATGSNRPMGEMAQIFNRIQGSGKLMGNELDMIEHGMPGFSQAIAKHLGVAPEKMRKMVSEGKVSIKEFLDVMEGFAGGMSEAYAGTWEGMTKNILSNIGIIGEALIGGLFEDGKKGLAEFLNVLRSDGLKEWAKKTGESIRETVNFIVEKVQEMKAKWDELSPSLQDTIKKFTLFGSIGAIAIGPVLSIIGKFVAIIGGTVTKIGTLISGVAKLGGVFGILTGPIGITIGIIGALVAVGVLLYKNWDTVKAKAVEVFSNFTPLLDTVKGAFQTMFDSVQPIIESLKKLWESLKPIFEAVATVIGAHVVVGFGVLISQAMAVISAIGPLVNAFINFLDVIVNVVKSIVLLFTGDFAGAMDYWMKAGESAIEAVKSLWEGVVNFFSTFIQTIVDFFHGLYMTLVGNSIIPDMVNEIVEWFKNMFQWLIDIVKMIIDGVVDGFTKIYETIKNSIEMASQIIESVLSYIKSTFENVLSFLLALVTGDFQGMKDAMSKQMESAKNLLSNIWGAIDKFLTKTLGKMWTNTRDKFIEIKNNMVNKITEAKNGLVNKFTEMVSSVRNKGSEIVGTVKEKFNDAKEKILSPIETAKEKISGIVDDIKGFFTNMKLSLPEISMPKLPKFTLKGKFSLMPPSVPKIGVNWNAAGGIFNKPTIFNTANAGLQGVGEAGAEAIIPLRPKVLASIGEGIAKTMKGFGGQVNNENNIVIHATIRSDEDIDKLAKTIDEKLSNLGMRNNAAWGG